MSVDIGDLALKKNSKTLQVQLFDAIRSKIIKGEWEKGDKLPSTRVLASELSLSRNTVIAAYNQLSQEGYIESRKASGFRVAVSTPEQFLQTSQEDAALPITAQTQSTYDLNRAFSPGVPDLAQFPHSSWQRIFNHQLGRITLYGIQHTQGDPNLRAALCKHIKSARTVHTTPERILITNGAQEALFIAMQLVAKPHDTILIEEPGYSNARKAANLARLNINPLQVLPKYGFETQSISDSKAKLIYITPSNQYPLGTSVNIPQRLELLEWAQRNNGWIIEDDYDSEFQFEHRPFTSMQGLAVQTKMQNRVLYTGSFSKVMFNGLRLGYLVLPSVLVEKAIQIKSALSGQSNSHTQAALAEFIDEGHFIRHIRRMRKLYQAKHQALVKAIEHHFNGKLNIVSQPAGLHVTAVWASNSWIDEKSFIQKAEELYITVRPISYYFSQATTYERDWQGAVFGFGNVALEQIEPLIKRLASHLD